MKTTVGAYILAAGESSRFGSCKALAPIGGEPMIQKIINAIPEELEIYAVTGAFREDVKIYLDGKGISELFNPNYKLGIGTSLKTAIKHAKGHFEGALVTLVDLPFVSEFDYRKILEFEGQTPVFSHFEGQIGPPVFFGSRDYNCLLKKLPDHGGAKKVFVEYSSVSVSSAARDIDFQEQIKE